MTKPSFGEIESRILAKYGHLIDFKSDDYKHVVMDIIEIWEDFERLHPLLSQIVSAELDDKEFKKAVSLIHTWSWHTRDHLDSYYKAMDKYYLGD